MKLLPVGVDDVEGPPVPIPNTEVKPCGAENSSPATGCENREMPTFIYSSIAQSVERMTVNHDVTGSSPVGGAKIDRRFFRRSISIWTNSSVG